MEISHPRRILTISFDDSPLSNLLKGLTGSAISTSQESLAGSTHEFKIETSYYTATIPIWIDTTSSPSQWATDFLSPEAKEVLSVLGAFIVCVQKPVNASDFENIKELVQAVGKVVKDGCGYGWDGVSLLVGVPNSIAGSLDVTGEEWEDLCVDEGFEWIDWEKKGRNEFNEPQGLDRLREALEANSWEGGGQSDDELHVSDLEGSDDENEGSLDFGIGGEDLQEEMAGMKQAIYGNTLLQDDEEVDPEQDEEVEKLQAMMLKMQAVRDMGADLPEAERKRFAAKAVNEIMKTL